MSNAPAEPAQPLFYQTPEALSSARHADWRLLDGDYRFAADVAFVPMLAPEFGPASRDYPILFADGETVSPVALLGLDARNLFVNGAGQWADQVHIPAYVRRYPFGSADVGDAGQFALVIDAASDRFRPEGEAGAPLFEAEKPTLLTQRAFAFCEAFRNDAAETRRFCEALQEADLLIDRHANIELPAGDKLAVAGFKIVSMEAFAALDADLLVDWHRRGWLALIHFHLASLDQFMALMARRTAALA